MQQMDIPAALERRYSTRKFLPKEKISDQDLHNLLEVVRMAPTAHGLQPFRVIVISDQETKKQLRSFSQDKPQITEAPHIFVFAIIKDIGSSYFQEHLNVISDVRNIPVEALDPYKKALEANIHSNVHPGIAVLSLNSAHIALGFLLLAAAQMEIDACPIETIEIDAYNKLLNLNSYGLSAVFSCAIGHRNPEDLRAHFKKIRRRFEEMILPFSPPQEEELLNITR